MTASAASPRYWFGRFELQPDERRLLAGGQAVHLGPHAFDLLVALVGRAGHLVGKDELLAQVWRSVIVEQNTLQVHVSALRKVLGPDAITTISGRGYRFDLAVDARPTTPMHNLPHSLTNFIGREREIAEIRQWLATTRLLTLSGAGGCGKTRLALQVASTLQGQYSDGAWLVELAPLSDPSLLPHAMAKALGISERSGQELMETATEWLASRQVLLLLDNAEHLIAACAPLADALLRRCAGLSLLVTSRERLGIEGELIYRVPSLAMPPARLDSTSDEEIMGCEAVRLFIDRAGLQRPAFQVTATDAPVLASICRRLDGIALAIELAATRTRVMSIQELDSRLADRFGMLTGGSRAALPRHRTLRSLIDWSHELLGAAERAVLRRVSVFAGGWSLQAAESVCSGGSVEGTEVLDLLASLTDKSLVMTETQGDAARFGVLETVRHYAQDRLRESGEDEATCNRQLAFFLDMAGKLLDPMQTDSELQAKLLQLDQEHDNIRAALAWCEAAPSRAEQGLALAGALHWFWRMRGHYAEGRAWIARLLAIAPDVAHRDAHASAFHAAGALAYLQGDYQPAEIRHRQALAIWSREGNRRGIVRSLISLGSIANSRGEPAAARGLYEDALSIARAIDDRRSISMGLQCLGAVACDAGEYAAAQSLLEECVRVSRDIGAWRAALALSVLGEVRHALGDLAAAHALLLEALQGHRDLGDRPGIARTLVGLATVAHDRGDIAAAKSHLGEALGIVPAGDALFCATLLDACAGLWLAFANVTCAARLWGCTERLREAIGAPMSAPQRARHQRLVNDARDALNDDEAFDDAWSEGRSLNLDAALQLAQRL
ncbi:ATP-binding protein [Variovorax rhizosphaerae]|uniref:Tetratricopeptide repeat protein n=1 Tax=Variovorax rhizosphaerae TaxID=1836200 RepID=A0ABU8WLF9_9BURK